MTDDCSDCSVALASLAQLPFVLVACVLRFSPNSKILIPYDFPKGGGSKNSKGSIGVTSLKLKLYEIKTKTEPARRLPHRPFALQPTALVEKPHACPVDSVASRARAAVFVVAPAVVFAVVPFSARALINEALLALAPPKKNSVIVSAFDGSHRVKLVRFALEL